MEAVLDEPLLTLKNAKQYCSKIIMQAFKAPYREAVDLYGRKYGPHRLLLSYGEDGQTCTFEPISEVDFNRIYRPTSTSDYEFYDMGIPPVLIAPLAQFTMVELKLDQTVNFMFGNNEKDVYFGGYRLRLNVTTRLESHTKKIRTAHLSDISIDKNKKILVFQVKEHPQVFFQQSDNDGVVIENATLTKNYLYLIVRAGEQKLPAEEKFILQQPDGQISIIDQFQIKHTYLPLVG